MVGSILRELRKSKNMTQEALASHLSAAKSTISQYENNINEPDNATLIKIANIFQVSTDYLLGRDVNKIPVEVYENCAFFESKKEKLNDDEAEFLKESLNLYRKMKEKYNRNSSKN